MNMKRAIVTLAVLFGVAMVGRFVLAAEKDGPMPLSIVAEKIRKGEIDVGGKSDKAFGMGLEQRFHRIHGEVLGLECSTCHVNKPPRSVEIFMLKPAVDLSDASPGSIDRRVCQGCHVGGPGKAFYSSDKQ